jgi:hypothetical protein
VQASFAGRNPRRRQTSSIWTDAERQASRGRSKALDLARHIPHGYHGPWWTAEELALLGTMPDAKVAALIGRTANAVRVKRQRSGIAVGKESRFRTCGTTMPIREVVKL